MIIRTFMIPGVLCIILMSSCSKNEPPIQHSKSEWLNSFFTTLNLSENNTISALSYWNENFDHTYLKINSSSSSLASFKTLVNNPDYLSQCVFLDGKLQTVNDKKYFGAFPDFDGTEDHVTADRISTFEALSGKGIAWAYFSNNWLDSLVFPMEAVQTIHSLSKTPFIRLLSRSEFEENKPDPVYLLIDIVDGTYDDVLIAWAQQAKSLDFELLAEFGTEMNGQWFPWNGVYAGGGSTNSYGNPEYPDGPEIFRDAYRHIIDICREQNVTNISWFFHFDVNSDPEVWWNEPQWYYPGDNYIDWLGVSIYGPFEPDEDYVEPADLIQKAQHQFNDISPEKPRAILEFGVTEL